MTKMIALKLGMLRLVFLIRIEVSRWCLNLKQEIPAFCDFCFQKVCLRCTDTKIQRPDLERIQKKIASICKGKNANCKMIKKTLEFTCFFGLWTNLKFLQFAVLQLNKYETAPNFNHISQNLTSDCLLI